MAKPSASMRRIPTPGPSSSGARSSHANPSAIVLRSFIQFLRHDCVVVHRMWFINRLIKMINGRACPCLVYSGPGADRGRRCTPWRVTATSELRSGKRAEEGLDRHTDRQDGAVAVDASFEVQADRQTTCRQARRQGEARSARPADWDP